MKRSQEGKPRTSSARWGPRLRWVSRPCCDAQSEVHGFVAKRLGIDDDEVLLTRTVGLEDAPEKVIKTDRHIVGKAAVDTDEHGLVTNAIHR